VLFEGGKKLTYRGYDSVGCATIWGENIDLRKDVGKLEQVGHRLNFKGMVGDRGLIQLRWATFGAPSKVNAQPHFDCDQDMVGAHNGNIVNYSEIREKLVGEGHRVRSSNDGELVVHLVEKYFDRGESMVDAIRHACRDMRGDYAFIVFHRDIDKMYAVKKGSSLVVGVGDGENYCSSDLPSILQFTRRVVKLLDGEMVEISPGGVVVRRLLDGKPVERGVETVDISPEVAEKGGYPHFMLKEIHEQPNGATRVVNLLRESRYTHVFLGEIEEANRVYLVGSGSSYNACVIGAYYFGQLARVPASPVVAGQFIEQYGDSLGGDDVVVCVSQSGETKDVINVVNHVKSTSGKILGVLNVLGSTLMLNSDVYLPIASELEISVPATKTFINQTTLFLYLAFELGKKRGTLSKHDTNGLSQDLDRIGGLLEKTIRDTEQTCKTLAESLVDRSDLYCLGYGVTHGTALEGALKIKEITYAHCEGMYSSEFKHGPLSIVEQGYPVVFVIAPRDVEMVLNHTNEVECRGGRVIVVAGPDPRLEKQNYEMIEIPSTNHYVTPILATVPLQLIAYYWSVKKGIDPDYPRNISKTITVD